MAAFVNDFEQQIINDHLQPVIVLADKIGGDLQAQFKLVKLAFDEQLKFLRIASASSKPSDAEFQKIIKPIADRITAVISFGDSHRTSVLMNHLFAVKESVGGLGWITVTPAPGPYVREMHDAGMFYTNRVLKDYKEKDVTHVEWVKAYLALWVSLQAYIKQHHTTGVTWSKTGSAATAGKGAVAPPPGGCPPPPPPPNLDFPYLESEPDASVRAALFQQLNAGDNVTKGLRKVDDSMKTHKNPALKQQPPAMAPKPGHNKPVVSAKASATDAGKPARIELESNKWVVEYQKGNRGIVLNDTELKQTLYVYKCQDSTIQVKGKINSITLDSCKKTALVFEDLISSLDIVNCQGVQAQVINKVPTVSIDKTDGCQIYLSKASLSCEIVSAKSSEMNVLIPKDDGDYTEYPIPEQFKTCWNGKKLQTTCNEAHG